jgi:hypothetical protein
MRERSLELALELRVISTAMSGDRKAINELLDELMKHGQ